MAVLSGSELKTGIVNIVRQLNCRSARAKLARICVPVPVPLPLPLPVCDAASARARASSAPA